MLHLLSWQVNVDAWQYKWTLIICNWIFSCFYHTLLWRWVDVAMYHTLLWRWVDVAIYHNLLWRWVDVAIYHTLLWMLLFRCSLVTKTAKLNPQYRCLTLVTYIQYIPNSRLNKFSTVFECQSTPFLPTYIQLPQHLQKTYVHLPQCPNFILFSSVVTMVYLLHQHWWSTVTCLSLIKTSVKTKHPFFTWFIYFNWLGTGNCVGFFSFVCFR